MRHRASQILSAIIAHPPRTLTMGGAPPLLSCSPSRPSPPNKLSAPRIPGRRGNAIKLCTFVVWVDTTGPRPCSIATVDVGDGARFKGLWNRGAGQATLEDLLAQAREFAAAGRLAISRAATRCGDGIVALAVTAIGRQ